MIREPRSKALLATDLSARDKYRIEKKKNKELLLLRSEINELKRQVSDLYEMIKKNNLQTSIQVDGRVSLDTIPILVAAGADNLVAGSTSLFMAGQPLKENKKLLDISINEGLKGVEG